MAKTRNGFNHKLSFCAIPLIAMMNFLAVTFPLYLASVGAALSTTPLFATKQIKAWNLGGTRLTTRHGNGNGILNHHPGFIKTISHYPSSISSRGRHFCSSSSSALASSIGANADVAVTYVTSPKPADDIGTSTDNDGLISGKSNKQKRLAILLCPAQFCVPADYTDLLQTIKNDVANNGNNVDVVATRVAPLPRTEWIKVAKQLPTKNFLDANLSVKVTLDWYFEAMENALAELFCAEGEDIEVCVIGHSIGGWVARAYLGGLSGSSTAVNRLAASKITSLITLGTPHISPSSALVDQTRGLLREIASSPACSSQSLSDRGISLTCVASSSLQGKLFTTELEELIAATSYLPLLGRLGDVTGDGIVPTDLAFMEAPAEKVIIDKCLETGNAVRHAHVLPTPWNLWDGYAPSWDLPEDIVWYGSPGVLRQWLKYVS